jgi:transmembrane sensor
VTERIDREDEIENTAALWVARLGEGPLDVRAQAELECWLAEDPRHGAAFLEAQAAWGVMNDVAREPGALRLAISSARWTGRRWRAVAALAAGLLVLVAGAVLWNGDPLVAIAADHRTAAGERRQVNLSDGSVVELGPASAVAVHFDERERRVELLRGVLYAVVAPRRGGEQRPFLVTAGAGSARALGTEFAVRRLGGSVEVVVVEHEVMVSAGGRDGKATEVVLAAGESVRYGDVGVDAVQTANLDQVLAWRRNWLVFDRVPLVQAVDELNRYRSRRILIGGSTLPQRQVSGVFDMSDPDAVLDTIARELGARTVSAPLVTLLY